MNILSCRSKGCLAAADLSVSAHAYKMAYDPRRYAKPTPLSDGSLVRVVLSRPCLIANPCTPCRETRRDV